MKRIVSAIAAVLLLTVNCFAQQPIDELYEKFKTDDLMQNIPYQAEELLEQNIDDITSPENLITMTPRQIKNIVTEKAIQEFAEYRSQLLSITAAVLLSAVLSALGSNGKINDIFDLVCILAITALLIDPVFSCIQHSCDTIRELSKFMLLYIPIYTSVIVSSGAVGSASVYQTSVMAAAQLLGQTSGKIFVPMMHSYMLISLSGVIGKYKGIKSIATSIKKIINGGLVVAATVFTGVLSVQSFVSSAADTVSAKTVKLLAGSFVPIIGGAFSDALTALQGSMKIIKASVGGIGIAVVLLTFLPALIKITVLRGVIWAAKISGEILSTEKCTEILSCFSDVLSVLTALLLTVMMVFIISTAIIINTVSNL